MRKPDLKGKVGQEFAAVRHSIDRVSQDPYDHYSQFIRVKLVEIDAPIMKHRSWGQGTYDSGQKGYKVEALEDSGNLAWNRVAKGDQYVVSARQIVDPWDTFTAKVEAREKAKVEARDRRRAAASESKLKAESLNERLRAVGLGDIITVLGDDRGHVAINRLLPSHVERLLERVEAKSLTEEEVHAVDDALTYYQASDYGYGDVPPESRPEGAEEHRAAIDSAYVKLRASSYAEEVTA